MMSDVRMRRVDEPGMISSPLPPSTADPKEPAKGKTHAAQWCGARRRSKDLLGACAASVSKDGAAAESRLLDGHLVGIESDVALDGAHHGQRVAIGPGGVLQHLAVGLHAEVAGVALDRAVAAVLARHEGLRLDVVRGK